MARLASIVGTWIAVGAAATTVAGAWRQWRDFDAAAIGAHPISVRQTKFAALRAALPPLTEVCVEAPEAELDATANALADQLAAALHRMLAADALSGVPDLVAIAEAFRGRFSEADNRDLATVRKHLIEWWRGAGGGLDFVSTRFALAPLVARLGDDGTARWVIGDFAPGHDHATWARQRGLAVARTDPAGPVLLRRER